MILYSLYSSLLVSLHRKKKSQSNNILISILKQIFDNFLFKWDHEACDFSVGLLKEYSVPGIIEDIRDRIQ